MTEMAQRNEKHCKYGKKCYRKNPQHLEEFEHDFDEDREEDASGDSPPKRKKTKIDDFFKSDKQKEPEKADVEPACEEEDEEKAGNSSGYVRVTEADTSNDEIAKDEQQDEMPSSPTDVKENIRSKFLVDMPEDFYEFWQFAKSLNALSPCDAFRKSLGLQLVGPFDILAGKKPSRKNPCWLRHWRYYYDPPEFLTVLRGDDKIQFHMGYFRDDPDEMPVFVASNAAKDSCAIVPRGENIFAAVSWFIDDTLKKDKAKKSELSSLRAKLEKWAGKSGILCTPGKTEAMKKRDKKSVCPTFHHAGMVVPVDDQGIGYREVPETPADLKKMLKRIVEAESDKERDKNMDPLMEIIMLVQFANDECDYGEGLELGLCLFSYGGECLHKLILNLLPLAYQLLQRKAFADIIKAHLEERKHSTDLSQL